MPRWLRRLIIAFGFASLLVNQATAQDFLKKLEEKLKQQAPSTPKETKPESEDLPQPKREAPTNPFLLDDGLLSALSDKGNSALKKPKSAPPPPTNPQLSNTPQSTSSPQQPIAPSAIVPSNDLPPPIDLESGPPYLGLVAERVPGGGVGLLIVEVSQGSPAWKAGFQVNDRILAVSGNAVSDLDQLAANLTNAQAGKPIKFLINRNGRNKDLTAVLLDRSIASRTQPMLDGQNLPASRAILGITVANLSDYFRRQFGIAAFRGAAVTDVAKGTPADLLGIKAGDCVVEIDGQVIQNAKELQDWISQAKPGQVANIGYYNGRVFNQGQVVLAADRPVNFGPIDPNMLSPDYVAELQSELDRVRAELEVTQRRMAELEQRLRSLETLPRR